MDLGTLPEPWASVGALLRRRGLRWTSQRRLVIDVLARSSGHVTGAEIVKRCRRRDASTVPSTVYRTLEVLEELGLLRHGHAADGRQEYHVRPVAEHGHAYCEECGRRWELRRRDLRAFIARLEGETGLRVAVSHVTVVGRCPQCGGRPAAVSVT